MAHGAVESTAHGAENASKRPQTRWNKKEYDRKARQVSFIHKTINFRYLKQIRKVPIQTQHRS